VLRTLGALIIAAGMQACASAGSADPQPATASSRYVTRTCPLPAGIVGYPLTVIALDDAPVDTAWLGSWARAAAYRWQVPSRRRATFAGYRRVVSRVLPDAPRWADDWTPTARHRAELTVTVDGTGTTAGPLGVASGDELFDRSLGTIFNDPLPASPPLPSPPPSAPNPVRLLLRFGGEPAPGERAAVVRFARQQLPVRVASGSLAVYGPSGASGVMKYDVDTDGRVIPGSVQTLESSDNAFALDVERGLYRARFTPAQGDCAPIKLTVVQSFGR
jgi:hypothetical protein